MSEKKREEAHSYFPNSDSEKKYDDTWFVPCTEGKERQRNHKSSLSWITGFGLAVSIGEDQ